MLRGDDVSVLAPSVGWANREDMRRALRHARSRERAQGRRVERVLSSSPPESSILLLVLSARPQGACRRTWGGAHDPICENPERRGAPPRQGRAQAALAEGKSRGGAQKADRRPLPRAHFPPRFPCPAPPRPGARLSA